MVGGEETLGPQDFAPLVCADEHERREPLDLEIARELGLLVRIYFYKLDTFAHFSRKLEAKERARAGREERGRGSVRRKSGAAQKRRPASRPSPWGGESAGGRRQKEGTHLIQDLGQHDAGAAPSREEIDHHGLVSARDGHLELLRRQLLNLKAERKAWEGKSGERFVSVRFPG